MSRTCSSCRAELSDTAKFCRACGAAVATQPDPVIEADASPALCPSCETELVPGARFCHNCATEAPPPPPPARVDCPACGKEIDGIDPFCRYCGSSTAGATASASASPSVPEARVVEGPVAEALPTKPLAVEAQPVEALVLGEASRSVIAAPSVEMTSDGVDETETVVEAAAYALEMTVEDSAEEEPSKAVSEPTSAAPDEETNEDGGSETAPAFAYEESDTVVLQGDALAAARAKTERPGEVAAADASPAAEGGIDRDPPGQSSEIPAEPDPAETVNGRREDLPTLVGMAAIGRIAMSTPAESSDVANDPPSRRQQVCGACGSPVAEQARFCRACGESVATVEEPERVQKPIADTEPVAAPDSVPADEPAPVPQPSTLPCPSCGDEIEAWAQFCRHCGARTDGEAQRVKADGSGCEICGAPTDGSTSLCGNCATAMGS